MVLGRFGWFRVLVTTLGNRVFGVGGCSVVAVKHMVRG